MGELAWLEGSVLVADDGQFLGVVSTNAFSPDSISNTYGTYGSRYAALSIFNPFGTYGSEFSMLSPWNPYSMSPPKIMNRDSFVSYLTVNPYLQPQIHPSSLAAEFVRR